MQRAPEPSAFPSTADIAARRRHLSASLTCSPGPLADAFRTHHAAARRSAERLWRREPALWTSDAAAQRAIANRLGWLDSPAFMAQHVDRLRDFADAVQRDRFTDVVLLGMGGSSLAPEVLHSLIDSEGRPQFHMLDSTDPAAVRAAWTPPASTLYILASKSGGTIEPNSLAAHFKERLESAGVARWADHFIAITDEGTSLAERARSEHFRDLFVNPSDIGGRYSAVSFFGLVPAALMGHDVAALIGWAMAMLEASRDDAATNPAVDLGLLIGAGALEGRDKLTLVLPFGFETFGLWIEQLIAESTGKNGVGVVPIAGEQLAEPGVYGSDRLFVEMHGHGLADQQSDAALLNPLKAAFPFGSIDIQEPSAIGAEFVRWEIATAIAGALLSVNPFDEPNVQQAKTATRVLLDRHAKEGRLPLGPGDRTIADATLTLSTAARRLLKERPANAILDLLKEGDYLALLAFLGPDRHLRAIFSGFRYAVRDRKRVATMFGYGPRYLHSTGQLHKGGPDTGVFVLVTSTPADDLPIPGEPFSFGTLELAQALGDFASLDSAGRRALHIHLPWPSPYALDSVLGAM